MATVMGGVSYGLYFTAKRYILPIISPPTAPQLEQDKAALEDELERLRAKRDKDVAALDELIAQLKPLIEEV